MKSETSSIRPAPWAISEQNGSNIYLGISPQADDPSLHRVATFNADHTRARIYNDDVRGDSWRKGDLHSLTMFPPDQILIARLLADRRGCYLHSAGAILNGAGMLFVGHSDAGKSTTTNMLIEAGARGEMNVEILRDDRNIVRKCSATNGTPFPSAAEGHQGRRGALAGDGTQTTVLMRALTRADGFRRLQLESL